ncbi:MAG TPA: DUF2892 domain-containing protein [Ohtaekwangia sp.]|nr:DUF2892 domain-containing protein [Ohtaekwangia sp.]
MSSGDRIIRVVAAAVFTALSFAGIVSGVVAIILPVIAVLLALTAFGGHCPLYKMLRTSTDREQKVRRDGVN